MKIFFYILFPILVILAVIAGFLFKDQLLRAYESFEQSLEQFQKTDLGTIISEVGKEILTPPPLNIGGKENQAVFNKTSVVLETNIQRNANGLPSLAQNSKLDAAAMAKAKDMFEKQYFEHVSPDGVDPGELVKNAGYHYIVTGENLILGNFIDEKEMVQLWMDSPGHRANILHKRFTQIGVAVLKGTYKGETVWIGVQEFGLPLESCPVAQESLKLTIEANRVKLDEISAAINAKRKEIDSTNRRSEKYNMLVDEYNALVAEYNELNEKTKVLINTYNGQVSAFNACVSGK
jgi:uncharacterized protein YkwD